MNFTLPSVCLCVCWLLGQWRLCNFKPLASSAIHFHEITQVWYLYIIYETPVIEVKLSNRLINRGGDFAFYGRRKHGDVHKYYSNMAIVVMLDFFSLVRIKYVNLLFRIVGTSWGSWVQHSRLILTSNYTQSQLTDFHTSLFLTNLHSRSRRLL